MVCQKPTATARRQAWLQSGPVQASCWSDIQLLDPLSSPSSHSAPATGAQCQRALAFSEQSQLSHGKTLSLLAAEHVPDTATCPRCLQHGSNKMSQWAGLLAIMLLYDMNPRHSIKRGIFLSQFRTETKQKHHVLYVHVGLPVSC